MLKLAEHILSSKEATFDPTLFVDRYEQAVLQLLEKKRQGMPAAAVRPFVAPTTVVNLMDALRRSIAEDAKAIGTPKKATAAIQRSSPRSCRPRPTTTRLHLAKAGLPRRPTTRAARPASRSLSPSVRA